MSFDYIDVPSFLDNCFDYYCSLNGSRHVGCSVHRDAAVGAAAAVVVDDVVVVAVDAAMTGAVLNNFHHHHHHYHHSQSIALDFDSESELDSELVPGLAKPVVLQNWNCFAFQRVPVVVLELLAVMEVPKVHFSVYPMHQSIP